MNAVWRMNNQFDGQKEHWKPESSNTNVKVRNNTVLLEWGCDNGEIIHKEGNRVTMETESAGIRTIAIRRMWIPHDSLYYEIGRNRIGVTSAVHGPPQWSNGSHASLVGLFKRSRLQSRLSPLIVETNNNKSNSIGYFPSDQILPISLEDARECVRSCVGYVTSPRQISRRSPPAVTWWRA